MHRLSLVATLVLAPSIFGQSTVVGIDNSGSEVLFVSDVSTFVSNYTLLGGIAPTGTKLYAVDFNAGATAMWAIDYDTSEYGTVTGSGSFSVLGLTPMAATSTTGLTAHPNGATWYVTATNLTGGTDLWVGDITTGSFALVGNTVSSGTIIDLACDVDGNLYGLNITDDNLYAINGATGAGTPLGSLGVDTNFAQGMDFDWATNKLWATLNLGSGTGQFAAIDTTNGSILTFEDTTALDAQMEIAILVAAPATVSVGTPFCDPANANSTGLPTTLTGVASSAAGSGLHLESTQGPAFEFGYYLIGQSTSAGTPISGGLLCLNQLSRYNIGGSELDSLGQFNAAGVFQNFVGTSSILTGFDVPTTLPIVGSPTIMVGETWHFQLWHRDTPAGPGRSNLSSGLSVSF